MTFKSVILVFLVTMILTSCGGSSGFSGGGNSSGVEGGAPPEEPKDESIFDIFGNAEDPNITVEVNKYIWNAALEVLKFLPIETIDPFTGVIVTGYGVPPGGSRSYKATIYVDDPALDARSLNLSILTRGGQPASASTVRLVEDAILTRARQMRLADGKL